MDVGFLVSLLERYFPTNKRCRGLWLSLCAVVLGLGASVGHGQWLEKVIYIPDSLSGVLWPSCMAGNPDAHKVYVSSSYDGRFSWGLDTYVIVADADTSKKVARIRVQEAVASLCYNPIVCKLYASHRKSINGGVSIIDGFTDSVIATIVLGSLPDLLCCNTTNGKMYVSSHRTDSSLAILDGVGDSVIRFIPIAGDQWSLAFDTLGNKLYCGHDTSGYHGLLVIDGDADTVVADIPVPLTVTDAVASRKHRRLYCTGYADDSPVLVIINTESDTIEGTIPAGGRLLCINDFRDELYFETPGDTLAALDCSGDTVVRKLPTFPGATFQCLPERDRLICRVGGDVYLLDLADGSIVAGPLPGFEGWWFFLDEAEGRLYASIDHTVAVLDASTDSIVRSEMLVGSEPWILCVAAKANKIYAGDAACGLVYSLDCASGSVKVVRLPGANVRALCYDSLDNKVYCASMAGHVHVIDCSTDSVVAAVATGRMPWHMVYVPRYNRIYVANEEGRSLTVIDCRDDSRICDVPLAGSPQSPSYNPERDEILVPCPDYGEHFVGAVDCSTNTWVDTLAYEAVFPIYCRAVKKVYMVGASTKDLPVLDAATDSLLTTIDGAVGVGGGVNETDCKIYTLAWYLGDRFIGIVDAKADTVTRVITTIPTPSSMTLDLLNDKAYITSAVEPGQVFVLDGKTDSILDSVPVRGHAPYQAVWNSRDGRVYVCNWYSGSISVLRDSLVPGVQEEVTSPCGHGRATIIRQLKSPAGLRQADVYDITGRRVARLGQTPGSVGRLGAGVYFVREEPQAGSSKPQAVRKVVVAR